MADFIYCFGAFRLDTRERRLLRGDTIIPLRGKIFDTLCVLVENRGRLVRKEQLLKAVWPDSIVEENSLDHNICAIRRALGQRRGGAQYIETVPRQGYRFIAGVEPPDAMPSIPDAATESPPGPRLIERAAELSDLRMALELAGSGTRQVIFVTGEAGIGKSALVRAFTNEIAGSPGVYVAFGNCQSHYGPGEPYMPILEALGRLARQDGGFCRDVLARCAPSWLTQLPSVAEGGHAAPIHPEALGTTNARMLREMTDALEFLTAKRTLALMLEDLHWTDDSTVELLARIAQRSDPARLLVIATYCPFTARTRSHRLYVTAHELTLRARAKEIVLGLLTADGVSEYLLDRFGGALPVTAGQRLHEQTQGNPLFMATVVNSWLANGWLRERHGSWELSVDVDQLAGGVPDDLRRMIERQIMELAAPDQEIIEAASVAGFGFCPAAIAPALDRPPLELEARCSHLAEDGRFLVGAGVQEWPDGTVCESYRFLHSVHRDVVYERIPAGRKVRLHENIAVRLEQGHRGNEGEIAAELALHFREARDAPRALCYLQRAAEQALTRNGHREAITHLRSALGMLGRLPEIGERARRECDLLALLAPALVVTKGFADPEAEQAFRRAYELSTQLDEAKGDFPIVFGLAAMLEIRGHYSKAQDLMEYHLLEQERRGEFLPEARDLLACSRFHQGAFRDALEHARKGTRGWSPQYHSVISAAMGEDPGVDCHTWEALALWFLGYPDRALTQGRLAVSLAQDPSRLYSLANAQVQLAMLHQLRQEEEETLDWANQAIALADHQGYSYRCAVAQVMRGWALARLGDYGEGTRALKEGINGCAAVGAELDRPYHLALLADAHLSAGYAGEAAAALDDAFACASSAPAFFYMAELNRLRGISAAECGQPLEVAERWILKGVQTAQAQSALSLELRSEMSLADVWRQHLRGDAGRERVAAAYARFTEGCETPDLIRAARCVRTMAARQV